MAIKKILPNFAPVERREVLKKAASVLLASPQKHLFHTLPCGVMVARRILVPPVRVRILPRQHKKELSHYDLALFCAIIFMKCIRELRKMQLVRLCLMGMLFLFKKSEAFDGMADGEYQEYESDFAVDGSNR